MSDTTKPAASAATPAKPVTLEAVLTTYNVIRNVLLKFQPNDRPPSLSAIYPHQTPDIMFTMTGSGVRLWAVWPAQKSFFTGKAGEPTARLLAESIPTHLIGAADRVVAKWTRQQIAKHARTRLANLQPWVTPNEEKIRDLERQIATLQSRIDALRRGEPDIDTQLKRQRAHLERLARLGQ